MNKMRSKIVAVAMIAIFVSAIFAAASVQSASPVKVTTQAYATPPTTTLKLMNGTYVNGWNTTVVNMNLTAVKGTALDVVKGIWYKLDIYNVTTKAWDALKPLTNYTKTEGKSGKNVSIWTNGTIRISYNATVWNATQAGLYNETAKLKTINVDMNAPTMVTPVLTGTAGTLNWYKSNVSILLTPSNDTAKWWINNSGLKNTVYTIGPAAAVTKTWANKSEAAAGVNFTVSVQGTTLVNYSSSDNASNEVKANVTVKIDSVAPTTTAANAAVTVAYYTFTATDVSSGVATVVVNGTTVTAVAGVYNVSVTDGENTLVINITDVAGNVLSKTVTINATIAVDNTTDYTMYIIIIVVIVVVVVVVAVLMMRKGKGKAAEAPAAEEKS